MHPGIYMYRNLGNFCTVYINFFEFPIFERLNFEHMVQLFEIYFCLKIWQKHENSYPKTILSMKELKNTHLLSQIDPLLRFYLTSTCYILWPRVWYFYFFESLNIPNFQFPNKKGLFEILYWLNFSQITVYTCSMWFSNWRLSIVGPPLSIIH